MGITVVHPRRLHRIAPAFDAWVYADDDMQVYEAVAARFKNIPRLVSPSEFRSATVARRQAFVSWTDANMEGRPIEEWLTTPLHRNSFGNHLFLHAVWTDLIAGMTFITPCRELVVVTESLGLAHTLSRLANERDQAVAIHGKVWMVLKDLKQRLRACAVFMGHFLDVAIRICLARIILGSRHRSRLMGTKVLVETYLYEGDLKPNGQFRDRYFPGLAEQYEESGRKAAIYPFLFRIRWRNLVGTYRAMFCCKTALAPYELFVTFRDLAVAGMTSLHSALRKRPLIVPRWLKMDMSSMVTTPAFVESMRSLHPLLLAKAPIRLANHGLRPNYFIDWFENQAIDKACAWGFANSVSPCNVIATRLYIPYGNALSYFPSPAEVRAGVCPEVNWIPGPALERIYGRYGARIRYAVVPSFRYDHLHNKYAEAAIHSDKTLLVLLTHLLPEAIEILNLVKDAASSLAGRINGIVIKPHPILDASKILPFLTDSRTHRGDHIDIRWINETMAKALRQARLVVTAGSSSAVEAICHGLPVILAGRQAGLDFFPLEDVDPRMWRIACNSEELKVSADELLDECRLPLAMRLEISRQTREGFFIPVAGNRDRFFPEQYYG